MRERLSLTLAVVLVIASIAAAQGAFRVTYDVERTGPSQVRVNGSVFNDARSDALDVFVTAEAVDASGKVVASGVSYVGAAIPERGVARFTMKVPAGTTATRFRVSVTSFRYGFASQSP